MDKNGQINRLTFQLNNLKVRYENLQNDHQSSDTNWITMNRQFTAIKSQIGNYEDDLMMKSGQIQRFKSDIRDLTAQIQTLNQ